VGIARCVPTSMPSFPRLNGGPAMHQPVLFNNGPSRNSSFKLSGKKKKKNSSFFGIISIARVAVVGLDVSSPPLPGPVQKVARINVGRGL